MLERAASTRSHGTLRRRLASSSTWVALEAVGSRGLLLIAMMISARLLGAKDFGALAAVQGTITLIAAVVTEGLRFTAATQIARAVHGPREARSRIVSLVFWAAVVAAVMLSTAMFAAAPLLAERVFGASHLADELRIAAVVLLLEALSGVQQGILTGFQAFRALACAGVARGILFVPLAVLGAKWAGVSGILWAIAAGACVGLVARSVSIIGILRAQNLSLTVRPSHAEYSMLWTVMLPGSLMTMLWVPVNWLGMVMLVHTPNGYFEMGVLGAANQWLSALLFLPNVLSSVTLPLFSEKHAERAEDTLRSAARLAMRTSLITTLPPALCIALASPWIMSFYGVEFADRWMTLVLVCLTAATYATLNLTQNMLAAAGRMFDNLTSQLAWALTFLGSAYGLLHAGMGANALAGAMLAGSVVKMIVSMRSARAFLSAGDHQGEKHQQIS